MMKNKEKPIGSQENKSFWFMASTVRSKARSRVVFETITKMTILGTLVFNLIAHIYTMVLLQLNGLLPELIGSMIVLDSLLMGGGLAFIIIAEASRRGTIIEWVAYFVVAVLDVFLVIWQMEYFNVFGDEGLTFMLVPSIFVLIWIGFMLISIGYLLVSLQILIPRSIIKKYRPRLHPSAMHKVRTAILVALPLLSMGLAVPITNLYIAEGTVKRTVSYVDTNTDATFSIWNYPKFSAQVANTQEINLGLLAANETQLLTAFGKMNTTFYYQIHFDTETRANQTIARLKMLEAFNCTVCPTIWYSDNVSEYLYNETGKSFPGPHFAEDWIANARATLEFVITNNITNVVGICSDSEATYIGDSFEGYYENLQKYEDFLHEVQTNVSLQNPRPGQDTFDTVLCTGPRVLMDLMDGDSDTYTNRRMWGLSPSWTKHHIMLYRGPPSSNPSILYEYLLLLERYLGKENTAPVVGLTGTTWFAEGYFNGTAETFDWDQQQYQYDGIDGWEAMKREILIGKAMGFDSVSVFHLNKYGDEPDVWENYGMLDYYGVDAISELADEWNQVKTIEYPISSLSIQLSARGLFSPHDELVYDIIQNPEMMVVQAIVFASIIAMIFVNLKRSPKRSRE